jgi:hypothetical protein
LPTRNRFIPTLASGQTARDIAEFNGKNKFQVAFFQHVTVVSPLHVAGGKGQFRRSYSAAWTLREALNGPASVLRYESAGAPSS